MSFSLSRLLRSSPESHRSVRRRRLSVEQLEDRLVPATFVPTTFNDIVNANDGLLSLREAVIAANANGPLVDTIKLSAGTYKLTIGNEDDAAAQGDLDIQSALSIKGAGPDLTVIEQQTAHRIFDILPKATTPVTGYAVTLSGLELTGGTAGFGGDSSPRGGAIFNDHGMVIISNCLLDDNWAGTNAEGVSAYGGAIYNTQGTVVLKNSSLANNTVLGSRGIAAVGGGANGGTGGTASGGAIYNDGGTVTLQHCEVFGNLARGGAGGAGVGSSAFTGADGNGGVGGQAVGGALCNASGVVKVLNSIVSSNTVEGGSGGDGGSNTVVLVLYPSDGGNAGSGSGGGIYSEGRLTIINTLISANLAQGGAGGSGGNGFNEEGGAGSMGGTGLAGGVCVSVSAALSCSVTNSQFVGNTAQGGAGGSGGDCVNVNNRGGDGGSAGWAIGGGLCFFGTAAASGSITGSLFLGNKATGGDIGKGGGGSSAGNDGFDATCFGGGLHVAGAVLTVTASSFFVNSSDSFGGGLSAASFTTCILKKCKITTNWAPTGGGIYKLGATFSMVATSVYGNSVDNIFG